MYHSVFMELFTEVFRILHDTYKDLRIPLNYVNDYTFAVAVLLSAQTTDEAVNKATADLFEIANTPEKMLELGENELKNFIKSVGLYNNKAKNIIEMAEILVEKFNSQLPSSREDLESLPGIGRKSANVLLNNIFGIPCIPVDTHVKRLSYRIGLSNSQNVKKVEDDLNKGVPKKYVPTASIALQTHGRRICMAKTPRCDICPIKHICLKRLV